MRRQQQGFSLVELMVALLLGTLIIGAATQMFLTNQRSFQLQQNMSEVQETGRFAVEMLSRELRLAGLTRPDGTESGGAVITAAYEGGTGAMANDQLRFRFFGTMDCQGDVYAGGLDETLIENRYSVVNGNLVCTGLIDQNNDGALDADNTSVTLVSNVESFQVLYGVDREMTAGAGAEDGIPFAGRYLTASQVSVGTDEIVSIRIGLLVRAARDSAEQAGTPRGFTVLDKTLTGGEAPLDAQAVRRLFVRTIKLRNYRWDSV